MGKMYSLAIKPNLDKIFSKLKTKSPQQYGILFRKISEIIKNPHHFKPLRGDMHGARRVHIGKSFVLIFEIEEKNRIVRLLDYAHHDRIY